MTFEYTQSRLERARAQWEAVSRRLDGLIADSRFTGPAEIDIVNGLRERRAQARKLFGELSAMRPPQDAGAARDEPARQFEAQLLSRLLIGQQDSFSAAFRLTELAAGRIIAAERRLMTVILAGLALIVAIILGASWLLKRTVLTPMVKLQSATSHLAEGRWDFDLDIAGDDEIAELAKNFKTMTQSLQASFARIEHSNQELKVLNQEMEAFSYSVSHDLRSPLRSMDGFSLALLEDYGDKLDAEGKDALTRIRAASQRMGRLIDDLLRLSRVIRAELTLAPVDLSAMAHDIADTLDQEQPGRDVEWAIEPGLHMVADAALMKIAMQNLLQNAWKFTGKTDHPVIRVGALASESGTSYFVADNGVGFDPAHAEKLFGAFQRLHHASDFPGTGIGLAIVQRIIRRHGGEIRAEARLGQGATFFFTIEEPEHG